jgi:hypothetical protein
VSIDIRFRFVAVWNGAKSQDCDNPEGLKECLSLSPALAQNEDIFFASTKEKLDVQCR